MARDQLLEVLFALVTRPHSRCLHQRISLQKQARRLASSKTPSSNDTAPKPTPIQTPSKSRLPAAARVPLHVGLDRNPENVSAISRIPIPRGVKGEKFVPSVLARPLGLQYPPQPGQNSPVDHRTFGEKKRDFADVDKVMERRQIYLRSFLRPYFQDWKRFDHNKGKSFVSNERLFRADKALYFPNIWGETLSLEGDGPDGGRDTTPALQGKISLVTIRSNQWSEEQIASFIGAEKNPELQTIMVESAGRAQRVDINVQGDWARMLLLRLFKSGLRKEIPEDRWDKYFIVKLPRDVRKGLTDDIRDAMGLLNPQAGYLYLVDENCKIRWAGSADAWKGEVQNLNTGLRKLIQEFSGSKQSRPKAASAIGPSDGILHGNSPAIAVSSV